MVLIQDHDVTAVARHPQLRTTPDPARTAVVAQDYVAAASLDAYAPEVGLPPVHSTNRGYGYFAPPSESDTDVLYAGAGPGELVPYFRGVRPIPGSGAWLLTGRTQPWAAFWPGLRHLDIV